MSRVPPTKPRRVRLRKLLNFRDHYVVKAADKRFHNVRDWSAHREWIKAGERWLKEGQN